MAERSKQPDDAQLMVAVAGGDRTALATLYDRYAAVMIGVGFRMLGDKQQAEDLLHDVFLEAWNKAASYSPERSKVSTWLLMRLRSRALDRLRTSGRRRSLELEDEVVDIPSSAGEDDPALGMERVAIRRALDLLPTEQRTVLELAYFYGLSSSEVASKVNVPVGTVKSRIAAGLAKLRVGLTAGAPS